MSSPQACIEDHSVDVVVCSIVLCCIPDVKAVLSEIHRILKPVSSIKFIFLRLVSVMGLYDPKQGIDGTILSCPHFCFLNALEIGEAKFIQMPCNDLNISGNTQNVSVTTASYYDVHALHCHLGLSHSCT